MRAWSRKVTELSELVDAATGLPARSVAPPAGIVATTVPDAVIPLTLTVQWAASTPWATVAVRLPGALLCDRSTEAAVKFVTGSLKLTVNLIGPLDVGSDRKSTR